MKKKIFDWTYSIFFIMILWIKDWYQNLDFCAEEIKPVPVPKDEQNCSHENRIKHYSSSAYTMDCSFWYSCTTLHFMGFHFSPDFILKIWMLFLCVHSFILQHISLGQEKAMVCTWWLTYDNTIGYKLILKGIQNTIFQFFCLFLFKGVQHSTTILWLFVNFSPKTHCWQVRYVSCR